MAAIYDHVTGDTIRAGLQGCVTCVEAFKMAKELAAERGKPLLLEDDDGDWIVYPDGSAEAYEPDETV